MLILREFIQKLTENFHHMEYVSISFKSVHDFLFSDKYNLLENDKKYFDP